MIRTNLSVELPVGADAWINGVHVVAVRDVDTCNKAYSNCARCVFKDDELCSEILCCKDNERRDHENVHFERIFKR